jgi:hypothetical protein
VRAGRPGAGATPRCRMYRARAGRTLHWTRRGIAVPRARPGGWGPRWSRPSAGPWRSDPRRQRAAGRTPPLALTAGELMAKEDAQLAGLMRRRVEKGHPRGGGDPAS